MTFTEKLKKKWDEGKFVCVGLDSDYKNLPKIVKKDAGVKDSLIAFNQAIVDATADLVCSFKINSAFYEAEGISGWEALNLTCQYIANNYPEIPIILDAKRADIGNTNLGYVKMAFEDLKVDAITVHPYLGKDALFPFLERREKGVIILVKTSNPGAGEFQDLKVEGKPLYQVVAEHVEEEWNKNGNCAVVVGATYPEELKKVREIIGDMPILVPGIGAQGGDLEETLKVGLDSKRQGLIISSSRGIIFASSGDNFADAAREATEKLHNEIQGHLDAH